MATGFTAPIYDNESIEFNDFVLRCARAFFYDLDEIPDKFEASDFHKKRIAKNEKQLELVSKMSKSNCSLAADEEYERAVKDRKKSIKDKTALKNRYETMLAKVEQWTPTEEHKALKKFMIDQLQTSIDFDCHVFPEKEPVRVTGKQWKEEQIQRLTEDIKRDKEYHEKEINRTKKENEWVKSLRQSLKNIKPEMES